MLKFQKEYNYNLDTYTHADHIWQSSYNFSVYEGEIFFFIHPIYSLRQV